MVIYKSKYNLRELEGGHSDLPFYYPKKQADVEEKKKVIKIKIPQIFRRPSDGTADHEKGLAVVTQINLRN